MRFLSIAVAFIALSLISGCEKDNGVTAHCDNLVNDVLPSFDHGALYVPGAFTPNGDGLNDGFKPIMQDIAMLTMRIFDEDGNIVFQSTDPIAIWTPDLGTKKFAKYYYRMEARTLSNNRIGKCGEVYALSCIPQGNSQSNYSFEDQFSGNGFANATTESLSICP